MTRVAHWLAGAWLLAVRAATPAGARESLVMRGGGRTMTEPCQARSPHGFLGIEEQTISAIADFIKRR